MKSEKIVEHQLQHDDLDAILAGDGSICEIKMAEASRLLEAAKTEEERAQAKSKLKYWESMAREAVQWCSYKAIPHIGQLFKRSCGRWHVVLERRLENIRHAFVITAEHDPKSDGVARALWLIQQGNFGVSSFENAHELNWHKLQTSLGARLRALKSCPPNRRIKEARKLKKDLADAVDRIAIPRIARPKSNASQVLVRDETGRERFLRLEVLAIDTARELAAKLQDTPSRGAIRAALVSRLSGLDINKHSTWTGIWDRAGLDDLPEADKWTVQDKARG